MPLLGAPPVVSPNPSQNQADAQGVRTAQDIAKRVFEGHVKSLQARRDDDLVREMLLLHTDGSGDNQYAAILHGTRVAIPSKVTEFRVSENLLRPIVDNAVAQHVTNPFRFTCIAKADRESREKSRTDAAWANHLAEEQDLNGAFGQAMYMAMPGGFCPVHRYWRDDLNFDPYEPLYHKQDEIQQMGGALPQRGMIDVWVGNPFDTTFNNGAKRGSVRVMRYGRVLPADQVRQAFQNNKFTDVGSLEGSTKLPSAAVFQRIARRWHDTGLATHGHNAWMGRGDEEEELMSLVCEEVAPGVDSQWPNGRLTVIAVPGSADTYRGKGEGKHAALLADQPLPAGDFSWDLVYSHHAFDNVTGAPWVEPLSRRQVDYNIMLSYERGLIERGYNAPTIVNGEIDANDFDFDGYTILQALSGVGGVNARTLEVSAIATQAVQAAIVRIRESLFTIGGYQAASRGESQPGAAAAKVVFEAKQDDSIHGPRDMVFRRTACDFMRGSWKLMKAYGDVPWILNTVGEEYEHLIDPWVSSERLSEEPPQYRMTSAFGATPEAHANELVSLSQTVIEGQPAITRDEFRQRYPNRDIFSEDSDPKAVQRRRARKVVAEIRRAAEGLSSQLQGAQQQVQAVPPQWQPQAQQQVAQLQSQAFAQVAQDIESRFPLKRSDDLMAFVSALTELVQDEAEDPLARQVGEWKLEQYFAWQLSMSQGMGAPVNVGPMRQQQNQASQMGQNNPRTEQGLGSAVNDLTKEAAGAA